MSQPLLDQEPVVLAVALATTAPAWVVQHYCAGLGPFGRSAGIYAATPEQAQKLQANPLLHVVLAGADATDLQKAPTSDLEAEVALPPAPSRKKRA